MTQTFPCSPHSHPVSTLTSLCWISLTPQACFHHTDAGTLQGNEISICRAHDSHEGLVLTRTLAFIVLSERTPLIPQHHHVTRCPPSPQSPPYIHTPPLFLRAHSFPISQTHNPFCSQLHLRLPPILLPLPLPAQKRLQPGPAAAPSAGRLRPCHATWGRWGKLLHPY